MSDEEIDLDGLFYEERPKTPPPSVKTYTTAEGRCVNISLVHGHPLWGHVLYPAATNMSRYLESNRKLVSGKTVLELGAGGGLPGVVAGLLDAKAVVISDFPDPELISNIKKNIDNNISSGTVFGEGFTWGSNPQALLEHLPADTQKFDIILLSDLVFNHSQHEALLQTCGQLLTPSTVPAHPVDVEDPSTLPFDAERAVTTPVVLNFYSHHRPTPELIEKDKNFVRTAAKMGWTVHKIWENPNAGPAFPEDGGDLNIRSTVHGWALTR